MEKRDRPEVPAVMVRRIRRVLSALPECHEETAWVGTRWQVGHSSRRATIAHVFGGEDQLFRISTRNGPATTLALMEAAARAQIDVQSLSVQSTTLDDVFVHYTGRGLRDALQDASAKDSPFMLRRG